jgi:hypothetical protein
MVMLYEAPRPLDFLFSEASGGRSRENAVIGQSLPAATAIPLPAGTLLFPEGANLGTPLLTGKLLPVTVAGITGATSQINAVTAILMYPTDARDGDVRASVIQRDAEVVDALLQFNLAVANGDAFDEDEIAAAIAALLANGIIVRRGVLPDSVPYPPIEPSP